MFHASIGWILTLTSLCIAASAPDKPFANADSTETEAIVNNDLPATASPEHHHAIEELLEDDDPRNIYKRSPAYNFGLGKRAYSYYVSEFKRLPVYNFGLGKRSLRSGQYSFGLGKRSVGNDRGPNDDMADERYPYANSIDEHGDVTDLMDLYDSSSYDLEKKRARPYSFGLGKRYQPDTAIGDREQDEKRSRAYEFGLGKRAQMYNFGLGKRPSGNKFDFGLGKRMSQSKFNFGLGKRERGQNRFNFGLGKRADDQFEQDIPLNDYLDD